MTLKALIQQMALSSGLPAVQGTRRRRRSAPEGSVEIFFSHHVVGDEDSGELRADQLHERIRYLQRTRDVVSLGEAISWLENPRRPARLAVLTFDDGYRNNLLDLVPVLRATGAPGTVFVATEPVLNGDYLWFDRTRTAICAAGDAAVRQLALPWVRALWAEGPPEPPERKLRHHLHRLRPAERQERIEELLAALPPVQPETRMDVLTPGELRALANEPLITIGAHTHTHQVLAVCTAADAADELAENCRILEELIGYRPDTFAYPKGELGDFTIEGLRVLQEAGIRAAVTTIAGLNLPGANMLMLNRIPLGDGPLSRFAWQTDFRSVAG